MDVWMYVWMYGGMYVWMYGCMYDDAHVGYLSYHVWLDDLMTWCYLLFRLSMCHLLILISYMSHILDTNQHILKLSIYDSDVVKDRHMGNAYIRPSSFELNKSYDLWIPLTMVCVMWHEMGNDVVNSVCRISFVPVMCVTYYLLRGMSLVIW